MYTYIHLYTYTWIYMYRYIYIYAPGAQGRRPPSLAPHGMVPLLSPQESLNLDHSRSMRMIMVMMMTGRGPFQDHRRAREKGARQSGTMP